MKWNSQDLLYRATFCPAQSRDVRKGMDFLKKRRKSKASFCERVTAEGGMRQT